MYARVVTFEDSDQQEVAKFVEMVQGESGPPEGVPSIGFRVLRSVDGSKLFAVGYFDSEEDMRAGHERLEQMDPPTGSLGRKVAVDLCEIVVEMRA